MPVCHFGQRRAGRVSRVEAVAVRSGTWDAVGTILQQAAERFVMPRFARLATGEVELKAPGEPVTIADREAETFISKGLSLLMPEALVVGEEACANDACLLSQLGQGWVWLVDPIDGTANFAAARSPFAMMVALLRDGEILGSCILDPPSRRLATAELGAGAWVGDQRVQTQEGPCTVGELSGIISTAFIPENRSGMVSTIKASVAEVVPTVRCAGYEYPQVARGKRDFALYWRTLPWDHAPGALFLREAGGSVTHLDGLPYRPHEQRPGLLLARTPQIGRELLSLVKSTL